jgi:hypothetical protein
MDVKIMKSLIYRATDPEPENADGVSTVTRVIGVPRFAIAVNKGD